ncbi:tRNA (adenosine(37)-N6)-threonylcarbamoyltransferase complex ATPase subunit type 1 TsaE [Sporosalibacterium faouarense]|uniref:tRNA (adenosine(37)-N6)-threonylcarbamoyltransferase complex ATPase subunit type 1 TsaE n=1 Tax=Sporosalibacterium faouarense TaxID=516123 RepID=UPI00141D652E|nr:tRNA (adenosine(37)-N6)-threonylcarbamoyltransferase complex ATPase subunit type 1 TsaE [Sporosalibacterium faouarense]MTI46774.1 tRNA (adenosine(37)-N6)-threonylcarbamoyltransferase complex ATPase subunit type 1 TsaE [Bacillota bacterium]
MFKITTKDPKETKELGYALGKILKGGDVVCLIGDLGAGKTTLTQSIAEGLDINDYVTSPTFTLINEYDGRYPLYHFDVYRINDVEEMYDLGYEEYFYSEGVTLIEWANLIEEMLPKDRLIIEIKRGKGNEEREILIQGIGDRYREIIKELKK